MKLEKSYRITKPSTPPYPPFDYKARTKFDQRRYQQGHGDMWPLTLGLDGHLYGGAGDNRLSPWISGLPAANRNYRKKARKVHDLPI
ncbi:hypothetical protein AALB47_04860 [Lachnospiraceae bacterium 54-11]|jgi:hypothetical protein|nr:hypothetical protein [Lachnospiraceae bacterium]